MHLDVLAALVAHAEVRDERHSLTHAERRVVVERHARHLLRHERVAVALDVALGNGPEGRVVDQATRVERVLEVVAALGDLAVRVRVVRRERQCLGERGLHVHFEAVGLAAALVRGDRGHRALPGRRGHGLRELHVGRVDPVQGRVQAEPVVERRELVADFPVVGGLLVVSRHADVAARDAVQAARLRSLGVDDVEHVVLVHPPVEGDARRRRVEVSLFLVVHRAARLVVEGRVARADRRAPVRAAVRPGVVVARGGRRRAVFLATLRFLRIAQFHVQREVLKDVPGHHAEDGRVLDRLGVVREAAVRVGERQVVTLVLVVVPVVPDHAAHGLVLRARQPDLGGLAADHVAVRIGEQRLLLRRRADRRDLRRARARVEARQQRERGRVVAVGAELVVEGAVATQGRRRPARPHDVPVAPQHSEVLVRLDAVERRAVAPAGGRDRIGVERHDARLDGAAVVLVVVRPARRGTRRITVEGRAVAGLAVVRVRRLQEQRERAVVVLAIDHVRQELEVVDRLPGEVQARRIGALAADLLAGERVRVLAVVVVAPRVEARAELVVEEAAADRERVVLLAVLRERRLHVGLDVLGGRRRDEVDGTGIRVASVKGALRALDDFDALERVQVEALDVARPVHTVDEIRRARLHAELHACEHVRLAADDRTVRRATEGLGERQAGGQGRDVVDVPQSLLDDLTVRDGRHRDGRILQGLLRLARRDDDLLQLLRHRSARNLTQRGGNRETQQRGTGVNGHSWRPHLVQN